MVFREIYFEAPEKFVVIREDAGALKYLAKCYEA
jgi:hypothetical protein